MRPPFFKKLIAMNNIFLGGSNNDPLLQGMDINNRIKALNEYMKDLEAMRDSINRPISGKSDKTPIWDSIDMEISSLSDKQKELLMQKKEYVDNYTALQALINTEIMNQIKPIIESSLRGKDLLEKQLEITKRLKKEVVEETDKEMEIFKKWQIASKKNPKLTYEEFSKTIDK